MEKNDKAKFGSNPGDWAIAIGALIAVAGLLRLISGVWTPDASASAGDANLMQAAITCGIGVVAIIVGFFMKGKNK